MGLAQPVLNPYVPPEGHNAEGHNALGNTLFWLGDLVLARAHFEHTIALYQPEHDSLLAFAYAQDARVVSLRPLSCILWFLGFRTTRCVKAAKRSPPVLPICPERDGMTSVRRIDQ